MKKTGYLLLILMTALLTACGKSEREDAKKIVLSNEQILVNGEPISENPDEDVYQAKDIIFYLEDQGIAYGEGTENDEHSRSEADAHTVVHITKPGNYEISGVLDAGQIFIDLGEEAKDDPEAVVNLILNNAEITCTVAPAVFFYNVYECETRAEEDASMDADLQKAGANLTIEDHTENKIYGSYVAKIYESCKLSDDGSEVEESKKLHKYDGAVYSRMSMNVFGDTGILKIQAENEGLDTEMHLCIQGGTIEIRSGNDGINVNCDNRSVFTMESGTLDIHVTGETGEGDGIDSNGWIVINGGNIFAASCEESNDAGIDADKEICINGGMVTACGNMNSEVKEGKQAAVSFSMQEPAASGTALEIKDADGQVILQLDTVNAFRMLTVSCSALEKDGQYSLWSSGKKLADAGSADLMRGPMGEKPPEGEKPPMGEMPEGEMPPMGEMPEGEMPPMGERPERMEPPKN